jgi:xylulokinase
MPLVAGVDSSTQSCKVVILDLETGALVRHGRARHPDSTEVHPDIWWSALNQAIEAAGGIHDVSGVAVAAQQHGMICLDETGDVVRPAMLWNDPRPAEAAADLVAEWGAGETGRREWIRAVGLVPQPVSYGGQAAMACGARNNKRGPYGCGVPPPRLAHQPAARLAQD